jgi:hypothetical protein
VAKATKLVFTKGSGGTLEFTVEGQLLPQWIPIYKVATQPREITNLRLQWTVRGCRVQAAAGGLFTGGQPLDTLIDALKARGDDQIASAKLVYVASGATLDEISTSNGFQNIMVEVVDGAPDPTIPQEAWSESAYLTLRISGEQANPDDNDLVQFDQRVIEEWDDSGLRTLTYLTELSVVEGDDVREAAALYARIPNAAVTTNYSWVTNGPDGVDIRVLDADEVNDRIPTKASCRSQIQEWGVVVGATAPGGAPGTVRYETVVTADPTGRTTRTTAFARGPNAEQWVEGNGHAPFEFTSETIVDAPDRQEYTHVWSFREGILESIKVEIEGGYQTFRYESLASALFPIRFDGAFVPARILVHVLLRKTDVGAPSRTAMPFPDILPAPYAFNRSETVETPPYHVEGDIWERRATAVYWVAVMPDGSGGDKIENILADNDRIPSYKYGDLAANKIGGNDSIGALSNFQ